VAKTSLGEKIAQVDFKVHNLPMAVADFVIPDGHRNSKLNSRLFC